MRLMNSVSGIPFSLAICGVMPVIRQAWGAREHVIRGFAVKHQRLADDIQSFICADACELRGPVPPSVLTKGFVIVPVKRVAG